MNSLMPEDVLFIDHLSVHSSVSPPKKMFRYQKVGVSLQAGGRSAMSLIHSMTQSVNSYIEPMPPGALLIRQIGRGSTQSSLLGSSIALSSKTFRSGQSRMYCPPCHRCLLSPLRGPLHSPLVSWIALVSDSCKTSMSSMLQMACAHRSVKPSGEVGSSIPWRHTIYPSLLALGQSLLARSRLVECLR